jgi:HD-like signal output (HDOD) protein
MSDQEAILKQIREALNKKGDMPIFNKSVNRINIVGSDPDSDTMELAVEVMKDANLSTKLLRLVNSSHYNRNGTKIGLLSQAIMILGFETVKNACFTLKMIDSFKDDDENVNMTSILVKSYLTAGFVREAASATGMKNVEESYLCGLFHGLGEMVTAHTLPEKYKQIKKLSEGGMDWAKAQQQVLGITFSNLAKELTIEWGFPSTISETMSTFHADTSGPIKGKLQFNRAIATMTSQVMDSLYSNRPQKDKNFNQMISEMSEHIGIDVSKIKNSLNTSFKQSCDLAKEYGLDKKVLAPKVEESDDEGRNKIAQQFSYYAHSLKIDAPAPSEEETPSSADTQSTTSTENTDITSPPHASNNVVNSENLLNIIGEITTMITQSTDISVILSKVIEGLKTGAGFHRIMLCLLNPQKTEYAARIVIGENSEQLKNYFRFPINTANDIFSHVIMRKEDIMLNELTTGKWANKLPKDFQEKTGSNCFVTAAYASESKPLGMFYADMGTSGENITEDQYRSFIQLVTQARLALRIL